MFVLAVASARRLMCTREAAFPRRQRGPGWAPPPHESGTMQGTEEGAKGKCAWKCFPHVSNSGRMPGVPYRHAVLECDAMCARRPTEKYLTAI